MIKKLVKTAVLGGTLLGMVASANAADYDINIYGASAQYTFWKAAAEEFLKDQGCDAADISTAYDAKHGIVRCQGGTDGSGNPTGGLNGDGNTYYIRYSSKASYDGIFSVQGLNPFNVDTDCGDNNMRKMVDETSVTWGTHSSAKDVMPLACKDVTVGASDVAASTFQQESHGLKYGPKVLSNTSYLDNYVNDVTIDDSYDYFRPIVVPFAFFRNADAATPVPFDNMSRLMATSLFSGQVMNWNEFDSSEASVPVVLCLRHAGSGTHATLDAAVMRGDYAMVTTQALPGSLPVLFKQQPVTYFNDGSSDLMRCVGGADNDVVGGDYEGYSPIGAVGYADADKVEMDAETGEYHGSYGDVKLMTWQGEAAVKNNIVNGKYDFWSAQWLYYKETNETLVALLEALNTFASDADTLALTGKDTYWAAQEEMMVEKATDFTYPMFK